MQRLKTKQVCATVSACLLAALATSRATDTEQPPNFAEEIRSILEKNCFSCHGPEKHKSGLRLDRKADAMAGGDSGKVILPGKGSESPLIQLVSGGDPDKKMPPKGDPLTAEEIGKLRAWIDAGAVWPEENISSSESPRHWAFKRPERSPIPAVTDHHWPNNPIDSFVLAGLEKERIKPSPEADRWTLIRRLSFDLIGLPPSPEEVQDFVSDRSPEAYVKLVDRLLASPHFGEHWGRHWLDLARYADSDGYEKDGPRPYAYLFRDWVIDAINRDLPFDEFTIEQLAGDLLPNPTEAQKIATGFHRQTLTNKEGGVDQEEFRCKAVSDRVNTTGAIWLGLTVGCAECHTHKYDPITQREYYQLYAFFNDASEKELPTPSPAEAASHELQLKKWESHRKELETRLTERAALLEPAIAAWTKTLGYPHASLAALAPKKGLAKYFAEQVDPKGIALYKELTTYRSKKPRSPATAAAVLTADRRNTHVHIRGDFLRKGDEVQPATLAVLHPLHARGQRADRLDLARWLVDPANPLTARVTVNQVWKQLFGRALVTSANDFGARGDKPSHPELLDWLALSFSAPAESHPFALGWSRKALIKLIVTSRTYRQSSAHRPELADLDPTNLLLARQNRFRLEAENVRDAYLAASGLLNPRLGGPSIRPSLPADIAALGYANSVKWEASPGAEQYRRGLYIFFQRTVPYPMLMTFDAPDSNTTCTRRERSNTPLQALTQLNDPQFFECARALGEHFGLGGSPEAEIGRAFRNCLGRPPEPRELARLDELYSQQLGLFRADPDNARKLLGGSDASSAGLCEKAAMVSVCRIIMNLDEFVTRD